MIKSSKSIIKKISDMIEDDLNDAIEERFDPFEKDILAKIRSHNTNRGNGLFRSFKKSKKSFTE